MIAPAMAEKAKPEMPETSPQRNTARHRKKSGSMPLIDVSARSESDGSAQPTDLLGKRIFCALVVIPKRRQQYLGHALGESEGQCTPFAEGEGQGEFSRFWVDCSVPPACGRLQVAAATNNPIALAVGQRMIVDQIRKLLAGCADSDDGIVGFASPEY